MKKITKTTNNNGHELAMAKLHVDLATDAQRAFLQRAMDVAKDANATQDEKDQAMIAYQNAKDATLSFKETLAKLSR
jgi:hypothetical protein